MDFPEYILLIEAEIACNPTPTFYALCSLDFSNQK